jgi:alpha/beta superfamily hydrolase
MDYQLLGRAERASEGATTVAEFVGAGAETLFGVRHSRGSSRGAGVVICSGIHGEFFRNHTREITLARSLASVGIPVQRFHYRGTGHGAELEALTLESMCQDALTAARWLMETEGCDRIGFVGTRWGGFVAATAAMQMEAPLVLWDPVSSTEQYFRDLFRIARINDLRENIVNDRLDELRRIGVADILGYSIPRSLYESARMGSLSQILKERSESILIIAISSRGSIPPGLSEFVTRVGPVDIHVITMMEEPWWFAGGREQKEEQELLTSLIPVTTSWLRGALEPARTNR